MAFPKGSDTQTSSPCSGFPLTDCTAPENTQGCPAQTGPALPLRRTILPVLWLIIPRQKRRCPRQRRWTLGFFSVALGLVLASPASVPSSNSPSKVFFFLLLSREAFNCHHLGTFPHLKGTERVPTHNRNLETDIRISWPLAVTSRRSSSPETGGYRRLRHFVRQS